MIGPIDCRCRRPLKAHASWADTWRAPRPKLEPFVILGADNKLQVEPSRRSWQDASITFDQTTGTTKNDDIMMKMKLPLANKSNCCKSSATAMPAWRSQTRATGALISLLLLLWAPHLGATGADRWTERNQSRALPLDDLVAIGAISLSGPPSHHLNHHNHQHQAGRLFDKIASPAPLTNSERGQQTSNVNKLDYIVEFMRANKLDKFCDLLMGPAKELAEARLRLNRLDKFTLFVPTNQAMLLMPPGDLQRLSARPNESAHFVLAHAAPELVAPKLLTGFYPADNFQRHQVPTLSGGTLHVTLLQPTTTGSSLNQSLTTSASQMELLVNGVPLVQNQSYALQEQNNQSATYAIVHLLDRVLYPTPTTSLGPLIRRWAPLMAQYLDAGAATDPSLMYLLNGSSGDEPITLFAPSDDAFKATPAKLIQQLDTNRTYLINFLRGHLLPGLHFGTELAAQARPQPALDQSSQPSSSQDAAAAATMSGKTIKMRSLAQTELEFESKRLQSRNLLLVNSIPVLEQDLLATNGLLHLLARPLFEGHLLADCQCAFINGNGSGNGNSSGSGIGKPATEAEISERLWPHQRRPAMAYELPASSWPAPTSSGGGIQPESLMPINSNELERDESEQSGLVAGSGHERVPRSNSELVARNNRDFYRPSTAPVNLLASGSSPQLVLPPAISADLRQEPLTVAPPPRPYNTGNEQLLFDTDRYKVLNATIRQKLRDSSKLAEPPQSQRFAYDRPLLSTPTLGITNREPATTTSISITTTTTEATLTGGPIKRPYTPIQNLSATNSQLDTLLLAPSNDRQQRLLRFQPEDAKPPGKQQNLSQVVKQQQQQGKTVAPGGFGGCAFYDADCKRLLSKLVRLPPSRSSSSKQQHLDSTFGETTEMPQSQMTSPTAALTPSLPIKHDAKMIVANPSRLQMGAERVSLLSQPLPPWGDDERISHWRAQGDTTRDLARLTATTSTSHQQPPTGLFTSGISRQQPTNSNANANIKSPTADLTGQIFLRPIKVIQAQDLPLILANVSQQQTTTHKSINNNHHTHNFVRHHEEPAFFVSPRPTLAAFKTAAAATSHFRPTPYSVSPITTHLPPMFQATAGARLRAPTNFSALEPYDPFNEPIDGSPQQQPVGRLAKKVPVKLDGQAAVVPKAPVAFKSRQQQGKQLVTNELTRGKQELQLGDISVTSARLVQPLAVQASNQAPNVSHTHNFVRSVPTESGSSDFFQDRNIAEIMEDSGLRIDGQQVTFSRLKECLTEAQLLSLVTQTGNSLTIFLPTDSAFQRLIQHQLLQQRALGALPAGGGRTTSARLLDSSRRHLIPLVVRRSAMTSSSANARDSASLTAANLDSLDLTDPFSSSQLDRLTLDCASSQMRQILLDHVSARLVAPKQLQQDTAIASLSGHQLLLSSVPSKKIVVVDGQPVIAATRAQNGMVYVVNKFLNLTQQVPNVVQLMDTQTNLTTFLSYLTFSGLGERLKRETGPLTILAPTNEAFDQLTASGRQLINSDPAALLDVLRGHIVEGAQYGKLISMRNQLKTMNPDQVIEAKVIKPNLYLLDNQMTSMRLVGTTGNGVVNTIDRLIVPHWLATTMGPRPQDPPLDTTSVSGSSPVANLPVISGQPVKFEHPLGNGRNQNLANSFLFADNNDPAVTGAFVTSTDLVAGQQAIGGTQSPFLRVSSSNNNLTTNADLRTRLQQTSTKNMQLIEKLANLMDARKFIKYLHRSRVSELLKPDMNYVILVPTDQAIEKLPKQIIDMLDRDPERLTDLVNYHVLDTTFEFINTIPDANTLNTLNEKDILFNWHRNNTVLTASGAVVMGGIQEENIALLIVDRVLYPTPGDILQIISKSPILSNFTNLVRNAGLERQLSLAGPYTLFAPSDFAFNQLDKRDLEFLQRNKETAKRFLLRHLSQPTVFTSAIALSNATAPARNNAGITQQQQVPTMIITNSLGEDLALRQRNDYFSVNDVNFSYADVAATNGVVHVIDGLL